MATETQSVSPSYQKFLQSARAQSGDGHPSPPSTPSPSGNSGTGNSNSGSSGGSGGDGGKSGGGDENSSASTPKPPEKNWRAIILTGAAVTGALVTLALAAWSITPAGQESKKVTSAIVVAQEKTKQTEAETKRLREERRLVEAKNKAGITTQASTSSSCQTVSTSTAKRRVDAVTVSYGQCIEFVATTTDRWFWVILSSIPTNIEGKASFGHLRDETEADKTNRRLRCIADTNDTQFCDKEMQVSRGVRVDDCVTKFTQDNCLGYLQGKPKTLPLLVNTDERIRINM